MRLTYHKRKIDDLSMVRCDVQSAFYGLAGTLSFTVYSFEGYFGFRIEFKSHPEDTKYVSGCAYKGIIKIPEGSGGNFRYIEQKISAPWIFAEGQGYIPMENANEAVAREICRNVVRTHEAVMSYVRESILFCFTPFLILRSCEHIDHSYGSETEKTARELLNQVNWKLMFSEVNVPELVTNVIDYTLTHAQPAYYPLLSDGYPDALDLARDFTGVWGNAVELGADISETLRIQAQKVATAKATQLLQLVCGDKLHEEFLKDGHITIEKNGWEFVLSGHVFVKCVDPEGRSATLCIHTVNLSCHPIDELVIAYLHIKNHFEQYMRTAIVHAHDTGFSLDRFKVKEKTT